MRIRPLDSLRGQFAGGRFARNVGVLAAGTAVGQAVIVLASPLLARLYLPDEFGSFAVFTSLLFTLTAIASLRYDFALLLPDTDDEAAALLHLAVRVVTLTAGLVAIAVLLLGEALVGWTRTPLLAPWLWLLPVSLWGAGIFNVLTMWAMRRKAFQAAARTQVSQNVARVVAQVVLGLLHAGPFGLLAGDVVGRLSGAGSLAWRIRAHDGPTLRRQPWSRLFAVARRYRRFPLMSSGASLLGQGGLQLPALLLAGLYGAHVSGWYALGQRVVNLPLVLVGQSLAQVYATRVSGLARSDPRALYRLFLKVSGALFLVGCVPFGILALEGPRLFALVFGAAWTEAGAYMQILSIMLLVQFVVVPLSHTLHLLERQSLQLAWDAGRIAVLVGSLAFSAARGYSPRLALSILSVGMTLAYLGLFALMLFGIRQRKAYAGTDVPLPQANEGV